MADLPLDLDAATAERLARVLDVEGKIPRALDALGPVAGRDVILVDAEGGLREAQLAELGASVRRVSSTGAGAWDAPDDSADVVVACWSAFHGDAPDQLAQAQRLLRPGGRLLIVHDYGRDDIATLRGDRPEYGEWSKRDGPFLGAGFKIRVLHCFWTFGSMEEVGTLLEDVFGASGREFAATLHRPRLTYNVAVYHRTMGEAA